MLLQALTTLAEAANDNEVGEDLRRSLDLITGSITTSLSNVHRLQMSAAERDR